MPQKQHCCSFLSHFPMTLDFLKLSLPPLVPWLYPYSSHSRGDMVWHAPAHHPGSHNSILPTKSILEVALQCVPSATPMPVSTGQTGLPLCLLGTFIMPWPPGWHCRSHSTGLAWGQSSCRWATRSCRATAGPSASLLPICGKMYTIPGQPRNS